MRYLELKQQKKSQNVVYKEEFIFLSSDLIRVEQALMVEQEGIRDDIERVANQIEVLDATIRTHISRNTVCLDTGVLQKKRRKRRSSRLR